MIHGIDRGRVRVLALITLLLLFVMSVDVRGATRMVPGEWIEVTASVNVNGVQLVGAGSIRNLGHVKNEGTATFGPFDLSDGLVDRVEVLLAAPTARGEIVFYLDRVGDNKIAEVQILETGGYSIFAVCQGESEQLSGEHKVVMQFKGGDDLANVKAFRFLKPGQASSSKLLTQNSHVNSENLEQQIESVIAENTEDIEKHRSALITVHTKPGASISVKQKRHAFEFGTAINKRAFTKSRFSDADKAKYKEVILQNFNSVVHENAMKWYSNERERDVVDFAVADAMLSWSEANGLFTRGHCVYWGRDKLVQGWLKELSDDDLRSEIKERALDYMQHFKDRVPEHDMNNEMVHCHYYQKRLGSKIRHDMFSWCQEVDPETKLYVNDYSILSGGKTDAYVAQIKGFLSAGLPVAGIGVQGHFGSRVNGDAVKSKLDKLAQFNLPIKVTEFDANTKDQGDKALALVTLYSTAFAHPAVEGIYMWGFWEKMHWRPNAALWNADWSETLAAKWYRELVFNRWWTHSEGIADRMGQYTVRVFYGEHDVTVNGTSHTINVDRSTDNDVFNLQ